MIGASETEGSVGRSILWNLLSSPFGGTVFPVNPKRTSLLGIKAYPEIAAVPEKIDLAVIATPAPTVPRVVSECAEAGVQGAIIISAGFKECGPDGARLEAEVLAQARRGRMRIVGPNCLGVMSPLTGLNETFAGAMARPGNVGFISQSGALCTAVLDWSLRELVGFSAFISIGSMLDVGWCDLLDYLGDDPRTRSIILYMESIGDPRPFLSAARQVALSKPVIVIKAGRTQAAARAAASHTGALAGSDQVLGAAFRRCGVLQVSNISDLFYMAEVLAKQPRPKGPRLAIVTNAGGPGVLATDALITHGGELAELSEETLASLDRVLPAHWSHNNPVDILGDADPERYARSVEIVSRDANNDGVLVILTPQAMTDPTQTAEKLKAHARLDGKPILASWMGGAQVSAGEAILNQSNIPTFPYPDTAARAFQYMWRYTYNLRGLYETPSLVSTGSAGSPDRARAFETINNARRARRIALTEPESKLLLQAYGIPVVETRVATTEEEAVRLASQIGYPVVLKLYSQTITHKTDVGGVHLNLSGDAMVRQAYRTIQTTGGEKAGAESFQGVSVQAMISRKGVEVILGSSLDPQFGPVLLFGGGGQLVEIFEDYALALPPLNTTLARRTMEQTRIYQALKRVRGGKPADLASLEEVMVRFSQLVVEQRWMREVDINPLLVSSEGALALDARVVLFGPEVPEEQLPKLSIRPYPDRYVWSKALEDGAPVTIRPIRPEDESFMVKFHQALSESTVYMRYFHMLSLGHRVSHERLTRICFIDYDREMALVAVHKDAKTGAEAIIGVGRLTKLHGVNEGEVALVIADQFQHRGLGKELLRSLVEIGRAEKLERIVAQILPENHAMLRLCKRLGFTLSTAPDEAVVHAAAELASVARAP